MSADLVTLTIDGKEVTVPKGTLIIRAAEQVGVQIPRFCDHPYLEPAGACRQCYVQIEGQPKLATSCTVAVAPGMVVSTQNTSEPVAPGAGREPGVPAAEPPAGLPGLRSRRRMPAAGSGARLRPGREPFHRGQAHVPEADPDVAVDRAGSRALRAVRPLHPVLRRDQRRPVPRVVCARGGERVSIAAGEDLRSPFSGNVVQICPVGALTATPYRFVARPFDLTSADTVCRHCSAGCDVRVDQRRGEVVRVLARENPDVNDAWICDKGRFAFGHDDAAGRITTPLVRDRGLEPTSFGEALTAVADACRGARVGVLAGGRLLDEDAYALSKLARTVLRTNDLDHRRAPHGGSAERWAAAGADAVTYRDLERAGVIVVAGLDAEQEVPILHLRLRKAAARGARIVVLAARRTRLHDVAEHVLVASRRRGRHARRDRPAPTTRIGAALAGAGDRRDRSGRRAAGGARRRRGRRPGGRASPRRPVRVGRPARRRSRRPARRRAPFTRPGRTTPGRGRGTRGAGGRLGPRR